MAHKSTANLSLPQHKLVRGYKVQRLALGGYLKATEALQEAPGELLKACFPGEGLGEILAKLKQIDEPMLQGMLGNALLAAPKHVVRLVAELTEIPEERLLNDPAIGLDGLAELAAAWLEVNKLGDFMKAARQVVQSLKAGGVYPKQSTGYKE